MRALHFPAADRAIARRLWARLDVITGYPRTHADDEPGVQRGIGAAPVYTETLFAAYLHDATGSPLLWGVVALAIDDPPADMLRRRLPYQGTTRTLGAWLAHLETPIASGGRGWVRMTSLPGQPEAWSLIAPRDGEAGSADGRTIPEGDE